MRAFGVILIILFISNASFAQSIKERLRQAREQEEAGHSMTSKAEESKTATKTVDQSINESINLELSGKTNAEPTEACDKSSQEFEGKVYYYECYCQTLEYPKVEEQLKAHGITYTGLGIQQLSDGPIYNDPIERAKHRYTCGITLNWDENNSLKFKNVDECYQFIDKVVGNIPKSISSNATMLYYGCGQRVGNVR